MEKVFLNKRGFTLLEILIVIAIIGILVSLGVVSYSAAQQKSRDSRRRADMKAAQSAWEQYYADHNGSYPATCSLDMSTYLPAGLPVDPKNSGSNVYSFSDSHCSVTSFCFCSLLESGTGNAESGPAGSTCSFGTGSYYCVGSLQ
jgi:prepilin-type N-terminal cleavage/methylation domain-containing protein